MSKYLQEIRDSNKALGASRIYTHGEKEIEAYKERLENGIPVNENTVIEIENLCKYLNITIHEYLMPL